MRSVSNILDEMQALKDRHGVKHLLFEDDNLTLHKPHASELFQGMIDRNFDFTWSTPNGLTVETLDEKLLTLMRQAGCVSISLAIESGTEHVLENVINKPLHLATVRPIVEMAKKIGFKVTAFFVVGMPQETRRQTEETFRFAGTLDVDYVSFSFATPLPGTELMKYCVDNGLIPEDVDFSTLKTTRPTIPTIEMNREELTRLMRRQRSLILAKTLIRHPVRMGSKILTKLAREPRQVVKQGVETLWALSQNQGELA
jgi:magnesium-protoporphyrin IX monomethyl ester (oxidative) cyclase